MTWTAETYEIAMAFGPMKVAGYTYRGLGLHTVRDPSPKGRNPAVWSLTHLGTGHRIGYLHGDVRTAFPIATEIADAGDWDFLSFKGWKDRFPDVLERLSEIESQNPKVFKWTKGGKSEVDHQTARHIAAGRP